MKNRILIGSTLLAVALTYVVFFNLKLVPWTPDCGAVTNAESTVG